MTIAAYWPVKNYPFINFDDGYYVYENNYVTSGLSLQNLLWAFSVSGSTENENTNYWHPLAWVSHMVDVQLFGINPHMHHLSNLFFHTLNTILLFLVFTLMTGDIWKCFFMAALFAIHPINIESTAWIAERKNLLSATFSMVATLAYIYYTYKPSISRYLLVIITMSFGILAKPITAILPCVFLLLDYWPLKRMEWAYGSNPNTNNNDLSVLPKTTFLKVPSLQIILEKIPLLLLSFASIWISMVMLQNKSQIVKTAILPLPIRIENAFVSYVVYLYKTIWPVDLAVFYPFPNTIPAWQTIWAIIFLSFVTIYALILSKNKPYLIIGWLWFLGVFFPTIGLIQGGLWPAQADRWAYIPLIGIFIVFSWGIPDILHKWRYRRTILRVSATCIIILLLWATRLQLAYWTDSYTLFNRAIAVTENNFFAYNIVGEELATKGDYKTAEKYFSAALRIKPDDVDAMIGLGQIAFQNKKYNNALNYYQKSLIVRPKDARILNLMGRALYKSGQPDKAIDYYTKALIQKPSDPDIYNMLGTIFFSKNMLDNARKNFETAINLNPEFIEAYYNLGRVASKQGDFNDALMNYKKAININPDYADAHKSLADLSFSKGDMVQAFKHYSEALRINPDDVTSHYNIGVILYQQQLIKKAAEHFYRALQIDNSYKKARMALTMTRNILRTNNNEFSK